MDINFSYKSFKPVYQGLLSLAVILVFDLFTFVSTTELENKLAKGIWTNAVAMMLFFIIINCIIAMVNGGKGTYFRDSLYTYLGLGAISILLSGLISGASMDEAGSFRWLFVVITMSYIMFIAIINTIQFVVMWAEKAGSGHKNQD